MSDPYNQYNQYSSPPPSSQGYGAPQAGYQGGYQDPSQYGGYQQQPYGQQPYGAQQAVDPGFGPPARQNSFGPPVAGGFQHGQVGGQYGAYDASNPQGHPEYHGQSFDTRGYDPNQQQQYNPNNPQGNPTYGNAADPNAAFDPNAPEGERGLGSSLLGGATGAYFGHKKGHGFLGAVGGAIAGNFIGDMIKEKKHHHGGSSWGGRW